jgi:hypothetical protein
MNFIGSRVKPIIYFPGNSLQNLRLFFVTRGEAEAFVYFEPESIKIQAQIQSEMIKI